MTNPPFMPNGQRSQDGPGNSQRFLQSDQQRTVKLSTQIPQRLVPPQYMGASNGSGQQYFYPPQQPLVKKRKWKLVITLIMLVAIAFGGGGYFLYTNHQEKVMKEQAENEIRKAAKGFAQAAEFGTFEETAAFMCAEEGKDFLDRVNLNFEEPAWEEIDVEVSGIEVRGDIARAKVLGVSDNAKHIDGEVYFRKEKGAWKVCGDVEDEWDE